MCIFFSFASAWVRPTSKRFLSPFKAKRGRVTLPIRNGVRGRGCGADPPPLRDLTPSPTKGPNFSIILWHPVYPKWTNFAVERAPKKRIFSSKFPKNSPKLDLQATQRRQLIFVVPDCRMSIKFFFFDLLRNFQFVIKMIIESLFCVMEYLKCLKSFCTKNYYRNTTWKNLMSN